MSPSQENWSPSEGNFKPLDKAFSTIVHGRLVQGLYAWLGTTFPRQYYIMSGNSMTFSSKTYEQMFSDKPFVFMLVNRKCLPFAYLSTFENFPGVESARQLVSDILPIARGRYK